MVEGGASVVICADEKIYHSETGTELAMGSAVSGFHYSCTSLREGND